MIGAGGGVISTPLAAVTALGSAVPSGARIAASKAVVGVPNPRHPRQPVPC